MLLSVCRKTPIKRELKWAFFDRLKLPRGSFLSFAFSSVKKGIRSRLRARSGSALTCRRQVIHFRPVRIPSINSKTKKLPRGSFFVFGGEIGIRTLVRFTAVTRFPVVRLRPAQPSLHKSRANGGSIPHLFPLVKSYFSFFKIYLEGDSQNNF